MAYAAGTEVSVERSRAEIEKMINRYGATSTAFMTSVDRAMIAFEADGRRVVFELPLPHQSEFALDGRGKDRTPDRLREAWEQGCRSRWRSLALVIKAKLEAVASGITTFEDEFLAHIMMPDGITVGNKIKPAIAAWYASGKVQPLLPAPKQEAG